MPSIDKITLINTLCDGQAHEMFDCCWVQMCSNIASQTDVLFLKDHIQVIENIGNTEDFKVRFKPLLAVPKVSRLRVALRFVLGPIFDTIALLRTKKTEVVIFAFNNALSLSTLNAVNKLLRRKIIICCHGELETLISESSPKGFLSQLLWRACRNFFLSNKTKISNNLYFSVIGESIKDNLQKIAAPQFKSKLIAIDHPYIFDTTHKNGSTSTTQINLGTVGGLDNNKGAASYKELIKRTDSTLVSFSHSGFSITDRAQFIALGVDVAQSIGFMSRQDLESRISSLDFILFFYPTWSYKLTASGAIMDAIKMEKPIIALKNDYFLYLFEKFGSFGYLCDSVEQIKCLIETPNLNKDFDFASIKARMSIEQIQQTLGKEIAKVFKI